jgi:uncharacterized protein
LRLAPVAALLLAACSDPGRADDVPSGPVIDTADILPAGEEAELDRRLRNYWDAEATAIVVTSVESLEGKTIEQAALDIYNGWGIGDADTNRGLLILVAPRERQVRIEVGCGLESVITDAVAGEIIQNDMIPLLKANEFPAAVETGVDGVMARLIDSHDAGPISPICIERMKKAA